MNVAQITHHRQWQDRWEPRDKPHGLIALLRTWRQRSYERQNLLALSDHMLRDIGITRNDALREAAKPFWRD